MEYSEEGAKPPFPDLTEDSNPVLVKLKLKKMKRNKLVSALNKKERLKTQKRAYLRSRTVV